MGVELTGGCQCGAVRFRVTQTGRSSVCHCRMCQKAFGSFFAPLVSAPAFEWTRGAPKWFASSNLARRGFCAHCGTPLAYETSHGMELAVGAFDRPEKVAPTLQVNLNDRQPFYGHLSTLPEEGDWSAEWADFVSRVENHQHPDHDTERWPLPQRKQP